MISVQTTCRECAKPMTVQCEVDDDSMTETLEKFLKTATCDECLLKLRRIKPKPEQRRLPYADD